MIDATGSKLYEFLHSDLASLSIEELEYLQEETIKRDSCHPSGSTAGAQTRALENRLEKELKKRGAAESTKLAKENLRLTRESNTLNKIILGLTILAVIISIIGLVLANNSK